MYNYMKNNLYFFNIANIKLPIYKKPEFQVVRL